MTSRLLVVALTLLSFLYLLGNVSGAEITGRVIDSYGNPINEVTITVNETISSCDGTCSTHRDTSDNNGNFRILVDSKAYSTYMIFLEKSKYQSKNIYLTLSNNSNKSLGDIVLLGYGTVEGRVVDMDSGRSVEDAKVTLDGETDYTSSNGIFLLKNISAQTNTLKITHKDYETYTRVYGITTGNNDLGDIKLIKSYADQDFAVSAYSPYPSLTIEKGGSGRFEIIVKNVGREDATFDISLLDTNAAWGYKILNEVDMEINKIFLKSGESTKIYIEVTVPETWIYGEQKFNVNVKGGNTERVTLYGDISKKKYEYSLSVSSSYLGKAVKAGDEIKYEITLINNGTEDIYWLNTTKVPEEWEYHITTQDGDEVTQLLLGHGGITTIYFKLKPPMDEDSGIYDAELMMEGINSGKKKTLIFPTTVRQEKKLYDLEISSPFSKKNVMVGESIEYSIVIENKGRKKSIYDLKAENLPLGWEAKFKEGSGRASQISNVEVNAEETKNVILQINPPSDVKLDAYNFRITVISSQINRSINLSLTTQGSYELKLEIDNLYMSVDAGKSKQMEIKAQNYGLTNVRDVELDVTKPRGWDITISPSKITSLPVGSMGKFILSVTPSADTGVGDYMMKVRAKSQEVETQEENIRVTVGKESSWGFLGFLMIIIAVILLVVIFRKFGRR